MPLSPIPLSPAFRHGPMTPWGGDRLRALLGKDAPEPPVGESLELSALPGMECRDTEGRSLTELLKIHGSALVGTDVQGQFPLLLKLLDAREDLSVQVHPDTAYAQRAYGKQGKEEAWVILDARPGARLALGFQEGVTRAQIEGALDEKLEIGHLLRYVPVNTGDAFLIPAGTVHAIMGGILLYEIQQSSDLTFRLHDWGRTGKDGRPREMHLKESLAVMNVESRPVAAAPILVSSTPNGREELLVESPCFTVTRLTGCASFPLLPDARRFRVLTLLAEGTLVSGDRLIPLSAGQTILLPANAVAMSLSCELALLGMPGRFP